MKTFNLQDGLIRMQRAHKRLRERWDTTRERWNDRTSTEFADDYLHPLTPLLSQTAAAVLHMSELLAEIQKDCTDEREMQ